MSKESKHVVVKFTFEMPVEVPKDWDQNLVEFFYNEGSSCAIILISEMGKVFVVAREKNNQESTCLCFSEFMAEYQREVTQDDVEKYGLESVEGE